MATFDIFQGDKASLAQAIFNYTRTEAPKAVADILNAVASATYSYWTSLAQSSHGWGARYARAIRIEPAAEGSAAKVYLDEESPDAMFAFMMEQGVRSWSIKDALLASDHAQLSKRTGERYIRVPFRYRAPSRSQKSTSGFAGTLPEDVYKRVLNGETITNATSGGNVNLIGLKRYSKPPHSQYLTFRTVTESSTGWQYPRQPKRPVFERVLVYVEKAIDAAILGYIDKLRRDLK